MYSILPPTIFVCQNVNLINGLDNRAQNINKVHKKKGPPYLTAAIMKRCKENNFVDFIQICNKHIN